MVLVFDRSKFQQSHNHSLSFFCVQFSQDIWDEVNAKMIFYCGISLALDPYLIPVFLLLVCDWLWLARIIHNPRITLTIQPFQWAFDTDSSMSESFQVSPLPLTCFLSPFAWFSNRLNSWHCRNQSIGHKSGASALIDAPTASYGPCLYTLSFPTCENKYISKVLQRERSRTSRWDEIGLWLNESF